MIDHRQVLSKRFQRQGLARPATSDAEFFELFKSLQPVSTIHNTRPGDPPRLVHRSTRDFTSLTNSLRENQEIVKARFSNGNVGYVFRNDFEVYASTFRSPIGVLSEEQARVLDCIENSGPVTIQQIKQETGLLNKVIVPTLHRLQRAFLIFESQLDSDWERGWSVFSEDWPGFDFSASFQDIATKKVLGRFFSSHVFATQEQVKDWSGLVNGQIAKALEALEASGDIFSCEVPLLGRGWMITDFDSEQYQDTCDASVFMLHKSDYLVRSHRRELKRKFSDLDVLQYLLIDGLFEGAVVGRWRINPYDIEDIHLLISPEDRRKRRKEIIAQVRSGYDAVQNPILRYDGASLQP